MRSVSRSLAALVVIPIVTVIGCEAPTVALPPEPPALRLFRTGKRGHRPQVQRRGQYLFQNTFDVQFAYTAKRHKNGTAKGEFHESLIADGETVAFRGDVICMALDPVNHRAWIGAVITENSSTHPAFQEWYHQPGEDVWLRVVDYGESSAAPPDRKTFMGFENTPRHSDIRGLLPAADLAGRGRTPVASDRGEYSGQAGRMRAASNL